MIQNEDNSLRGELPGNILARIERIEDIENIRRLRNTYHRYINDGHFDEFGKLFCEDAVCKLDYISDWRGRSAIAEGFSAIPKTTSFIKQFVHNHSVDVDGDTATGYAYFEAKYTRSGQSIRVAGRYDDEYVRTGTGWVFRKVQVHMYFAVPYNAGWDGKNLHYMRADGSVDETGRADKG